MRVELEIKWPFWVAYEANLRLIRWSPFQFVMSAIFPFAGLFLCYLWLTSHHSVQFSDVLLLFGCFFFTPLILLLTLFLGRRKNPLSTGPFKYAFDTEGIHASGPAYSQLLKWSAIQKVRESDSFLFFFIAPSRAQAIPSNQLRHAGVLEVVRELARVHVPNTRVRGAQQTVSTDHPKTGSG